MNEVVQHTNPSKEEKIHRPDETNQDPPVSQWSEFFVGFSKRTLLESGNIPIEELAELALREGQRSSPFYRIHRWFARRLSSQFRAMLTSLSLEETEVSRFWERYSGKVPLEGAVILDPFVGGGTSVIEASRCGARVIGYDIDPVAACITRFELGAAAYEDIPLDSAEAICASVSERILPFHKTMLQGGEKVDVLHHFWVELSTCQECGYEFELHPHHQLNYDTKRGVQWVFCKQCHEVYELPLTQEEIRCACGIATTIREGTIQHGKITCPRCRSVYDLSSKDWQSKELPQWRLFAHEYLEPAPRGFQRKFKSVTNTDYSFYSQAAQMLQDLESREGSFVPRRAIPIHGRADQRPLTYGFHHYQDLFNERQLLHLTLLGKAISDITNEKDKKLLGLAFSDHLTCNCMYTGYAFGYRTISPLFSIHSFRHITRPVELNPWVIARGTFPNALNKIYKAIEFAKAPSDLDPKEGRRESIQPIGPREGSVGSSPSGFFQKRQDAVIMARSSVNLAEIPDESVDLILTDPPYFDNLSYSELSDFYLVWHQALGIAEPPYNDPRSFAPIQENMAITNRSIKSIEAYRENLSSVFRACYRTLRSQGICVFTYHHNSPKAWLAVGEALATSGLQTTAVIPLRSEGKGGLHSHTGTIKWDAVLVCRKTQGFMFEPTDSIVVTKEALKRAASMTRMYRVKLSKNTKIGFREPDQFNLFRAFVVSEAFPGAPTEYQLPLKAALVTEFSKVTEEESAHA